MAVERPTKAFGIYHWDTFEPPGEDTFLIHEADTLEEAEDWVKRTYGQRLKPSGADRVEVVAADRVVRRYRVG